MTKTDVTFFLWVYFHFIEANYLTKPSLYILILFLIFLILLSGLSNPRYLLRPSVLQTLGLIPITMRTVSVIYLLYPAISSLDIYLSLCVRCWFVIRSSIYNAGSFSIGMCTLLVRYYIQRFHRWIYTYHFVSRVR